MIGNSLAMLLCSLSLAVAAQVMADEMKVSYLDAGSIVDFKPPARRDFFDSDLRTYCYRGGTKSLGRFFESVQLHLEIEGDDYTQYEGSTPAEVREHHDQQRSLFSFSLFGPQKRTRLQLSPFAQQCIGIETIQPYRVRLQLVRVEFWRVIQLTVAVMLFTYANELSHNSIFYYITGILLGICSSFMLLIWLSSKLVPRRTMMYGVLIGGWTIGIYVLQMLWENLRTIVLTYRMYVFWYILITGVVSFFFCYRLGPPKNRRSKNIVKWLLQFIALLTIYLSSQFEEATAAIIILTIVIHYFPRKLLYRTRAWYFRRFPSIPRLLTSEEYLEQGVRETTNALDELRKFASSPDCKQWKVMSKLRDPMRFAAFVEGASHLRDEEILRFENTNYNDDELQDSEMSLDEDTGEEEPVTERLEQSRGPYILQRSQRNYQMMNGLAHRPDNADEISEDEEEDDDAEDREEQVIHLTRTSYNMRHATPTHLSAPLNSATRRQSPSLSARSNGSRSQTRSARMVSNAQNQHSLKNNRPSGGASGFVQHRPPFPMRREFSAEDEDY